MANPPQGTKNNNDGTQRKRFNNFAQFFKGYMSVSTIIVAALPIAFDQLGVIPGFDVHKQFLPTYTSLFCFLILAFSFFSRYRLAWWMFHNELNGRSIGFARQFKTIFRFIPFFLIGICFACIIFYHNFLDQSVIAIRNKVIPEGASEINKSASLKYFGESLKINTPEPTNIKDFEANTNKLNSHFILKYADPSSIYYKSSNGNNNDDLFKLLSDKILLIISTLVGLVILIFFMIYKNLFNIIAYRWIFSLSLISTLILSLIILISYIFINLLITNNSRLIISYLGIFLSAETAFILMALREYLQEVLDDPDDSDLFRKVNAGKLNASVCQNINNQDSREICYFFLETNAKLERNVYQKRIIDLINHKTSTSTKLKKFPKVATFIFDHTNYLQDIIDEKISSDVQENQTKLPYDIHELSNYLEQLKHTFATLNKWEKVEQVDNIMSKLHQKDKFRYLNLFSDSGYDKKDYYLSLENAIKAIEQKGTNGLTFDKLLNDMRYLKAKREKTAKDNLFYIIVYLLQLNYQPERYSLSLIKSIDEHRQNLYNDFEKSPSLEQYCQKKYSNIYKKVYQKIVNNTGLSIIHFMNEDQCPFTFKQIIKKDWYEFTN